MIRPLKHDFQCNSEELLHLAEAYKKKRRVRWRWADHAHDFVDEYKKEIYAMFERYYDSEDAREITAMNGLFFVKVGDQSVFLAARTQQTLFTRTGWKEITVSPNFTTKGGKTIKLVIQNEAAHKKRG